MQGGVTDDNGFQQVFPKTTLTKGKLIVPTSMQGYVALDADPVDMAALIGLVWSGLDEGETLDAIGGTKIVEQAIWVLQMNFRSLSAVGVLNTSYPVSEEWEGTDEGRSSDDLDPVVAGSSPTPERLGLFLASSLSIAFDWFLKIEFEVTLTQKQWADDPDDWSGYEEMEVDYYA